MNATHESVFIRATHVGTKSMFVVLSSTAKVIGCFLLLTLLLLLLLPVVVNDSPSNHHLLMLLVRDPFPAMNAGELEEDSLHRNAPRTFERIRKFVEGPRSVMPVFKL